MEVEASAMQIFGIMSSFLYLCFFSLSYFILFFSFFIFFLYSSLACMFLSFVFNLFFLNNLYLCFFTSPSPPRNLPVPMGKENVVKLIFFHSADENPEVAHRAIQRDGGRSAVAKGVFFVSSLLQELILRESGGLRTGKGSEILARNRKQVT